MDLTLIKKYFGGNEKAVDDSTQPPIFLRWRASQAFILFTVSFGVFTDCFFYGSVVILVPFSIKIQTNIAEDQLEKWTAILMGVYGIALGVGSPLAGLWTDRSKSRRFPLLLGLLFLLAGTFIMCFSKSINVMVLGRIFQGISCAIMWSVGLALLVDTFGNHRIGWALGVVDISFSAGILISPFAAGTLLEIANSYAVYGLAFGFIAIDAVLRLAFVEPRVARQWLGPDFGAWNHDTENPVTPKTSSVSSSGILSGTSSPSQIGMDSDQSQNSAAKQAPYVWTILKSRRMATALFCCVSIFAIQ
jgi:MFS family permease